MTEIVVLDTSAVLALLNDEPGAQVVRSMIFGARLSTVTLAEVYSTLSFRGQDGPAALKELRFALDEVVPFDERMAEVAGELRSATSAAGLSLGDRACLALGMSLNAPVYTADRIWASLRLPCIVHLIR